MAIRVVVAGFGARGRQWIAEAREEAELEIVGAADIDGSAPYATLGQALDAVECDAVIVATSADAHEEACELAIDRGLAVMVEKPFTTNLAAAERIVERAEARGVPLIVAQNFRYLRAYRAARRVIDEGALGAIGQVTCHYFHGKHHMAPSLARMRHSVLWGVGVHHLDGLRWMLRREVTGVFAESFTASYGTLPHGASMQALLAFDGGARAVYSASYESSGHEWFERGQEFYARLTGERATLHMLHRWLILCERGKLPRLVRRGSRPISEERALLRELARVIRDGGESEASGRDNLKTMAIVEACVQSAEERRWVDPRVILSRETARWAGDGC